MLNYQRVLFRKAWWKSAMHPTIISFGILRVKPICEGSAAPSQRVPLEDDLPAHRRKVAKRFIQLPNQTYSILQPCIVCILHIFFFGSHTFYHFNETF
jgi:hypothetical protein